MTHFPALNAMGRRRNVKHSPPRPPPSATAEYGNGSGSAAP
jgi:hypothetical protein